MAIAGDGSWTVEDAFLDFFLMFLSNSSLLSCFLLQSFSQYSKLKCSHVVLKVMFTVALKCSPKL